MVSVIVPVYNAEKYIDRCVESILNQTYRDIEVILVDDGSQDKSYEICKRYTEQYKNIKVMHIENHGASHARNIGIDASVGEYIQFVDSDDYINKDMIETLLTEQIRRNTAIVLCGYYREEDKKTTSVVPKDADCSFNEFDKVISYWEYDPIIGSPCNKLFDAQILKDNRIYFREGMNYGEDFCFCMDYYCYIDKFSTISKAMYHYRDTPNSLTKRNTVDIERFWNDQLIACKSIFKFVESKGVSVEDSESAKQAYSYMCSLNFYRRLCLYGLFKSIRWFQDNIAKSKYRILIKKTKRISRVGKLNYIFKIIKLMDMFMIGI